MKHLHKTIFLYLLTLGFVACDKDNKDEMQSQNVAKVSFVYTLNTSSGNSMTRTAATNAEVFSEFYEKMKSGELAAETYELTLTEVESGASYELNGKWDSPSFITLPVGTYRVVGSSIAEGTNLQKRCSFAFDEQIEISATSGVITLHAKYECFLLVFSNPDIESLENYNGIESQSFFTFGNYKYAFVNGTLFNDEQKFNAYILGKYSDNLSFKIFTENLKFEVGKYYVYNSMSNSFDVPPMENGQGVKNGEIEGFGRVADAIDLGLSVKWASWNVGASQIADYGGLYGAGDPTGLLTSMSYDDYYYEYGRSICGTEYDLAAVKWQGNWRLPTMEELEELKDECTWAHDVCVDGVYGSKATGPNGNSIFIPYAGYRHGNSSYNRDYNASLWAGEMGVSLHSYGYKDLDIRYDGDFGTDGGPCYAGQSIRPVCD